jgi:hypothetical protein
MGELIVTFGEDGKAHMYDSDFDVTIHCEDEQRMNEAVELLHLANRMHWRKTSENPPTEKDAAYGKVIAVFMDAKFAQAAPWELAWEDVQFGLEYYKQPLPGGAMFWKRIDQNRQHAGIMNYDDYAIILQDGKFFTCGWIPKISVIAELVRYFVLK